MKISIEKKVFSQGRGLINLSETSPRCPTKNWAGET